MTKKIFSHWSLSVLCCISAGGAILPSDWQNEQTFQLSTPGLVKLSLPVETLDKSRPALEDLRLYDDAGNELPYLIERPVPAVKAAQNAKSFQVSLNRATTVIMIETGLIQTLDAVTLESPAANFIKSTQVEASTDGKRWQSLAEGQPIFRQPGGASELRVGFPKSALKWLRITVDDQRSQPIPFTGVRVHAASVEPTPTEPVAASISDRHENPGETRLTVNLGGANLDLAAIHVETSEPLFTRDVTVAIPEVSEDSVRERTLAQGAIYRVTLDGQPALSNLALRVESRARSRELLLLIRNQDSPPLPISAVRAERHPVYLVFLARQAGVHHLLMGNSRCAAPRYDLAALGSNLKAAAVQPIRFSEVMANPGYRTPEELAEVQEGATALDVSAWRYRKGVKLARGGAQQIELDLDVLAHAQPGFEDLRLLRNGKQLPYILERTSITRSLTPTVTAGQDAKDPKLSRWTIKLSHAGLPALRLTCSARTQLFQRELNFYEELADERGDKYRHSLGSASWIQTPSRVSKQFSLAFDARPESAALFLETHNGDNPPIELDRFQIFYAATRILFKTKPGEEIFLYYGNQRAASPRYDLSLVASQLLAAGKSAPSLAAEEQVKKGPWRDGQPPGKGGVVFWGILALVVVVLLAIISRLLPKSSKT